MSSNLNKRLAFLLHFIVLLGLTSVAVWDAYSITIDYLYDNRNSLVITDSLEDNYPFLQNIILKVCLNYRKLSIFQQLWKREPGKNFAKNVDIRGGMPKDAQNPSKTALYL